MQVEQLIFFFCPFQQRDQRGVRAFSAYQCQCHLQAGKRRAQFMRNVGALTFLILNERCYFTGHIIELGKQACKR